MWPGRRWASTLPITAAAAVSAVLLLPGLAVAIRVVSRVTFVLVIVQGTRQVLHFGCQHAYVRGCGFDALCVQRSPCNASAKGGGGRAERSRVDC